MLLKISCYGFIIYLGISRTKNQYMEQLDNYQKSHPVLTHLPYIESFITLIYGLL
jgi:hypothetical protein